MDLHFVVALVVFIVATIRCLFWLARNYAGSTYYYLGRLHDLEIYRDIVIASTADHTEGEDLFEDELRQRILKQQTRTPQRTMLGWLTSIGRTRPW